MEEKKESNLKSAVVAIVGRTNAGKSTLMNQMVGEKVSIVSPVEQTTRNTIRGIVADPRGQLVLLDTPGLHKAVGPLGRLLNGMARSSSSGTDLLCVVFDASRMPQLEDEGWMSRIAQRGSDDAPVAFVLNKSDKKPFYADSFKAKWSEISNGRKMDWIETSAVEQGGAAALLDWLYEKAPVGPALFPDDIVTDYPRKLAIADVIREKMLSRIYDEVPHEMGILVRKIRERQNEWNVEVDILVNRESQKGIVIGQQAKNLKYARKGAEPELSEMFGVKVRLELWVKVEPNWMKNERLLTEMGYLGALQ